MKLVIPFQRTGSLFALGILLAVSVATHVHLQNVADTPSVDVAIEALPKHLGEWTGTDTAGGLDIRSQEILQLTRYVKRNYRNKAGDVVTLYIGYWQEQSGDYQAAKHSPLVCLPANGWDIQPKKATNLQFSEVKDTEVNAKRILGDYGNQSYLFYYWFFTGEENYSEEWRALINISLQRFFFGRSDGGIVEISARLPSGLSKQAAEEHSSRVIEDFLSELYPALHQMIEESTPSALPEASLLNTAQPRRAALS